MISVLDCYELWMDNLAFKECSVAFGAWCLCFASSEAFEEGTKIWHSFDDFGNVDMAWLATMVG